MPEKRRRASHLTADGKPKMPYRDVVEAVQSARRLEREGGFVLEPYRCAWCKMLHLGSPRPRGLRTPDWWPELGERASHELRRENSFDSPRRLAAIKGRCRKLIDGEREADAVGAGIR